MDKVQQQIHYWAHMLDETKHLSYYDVYMATNPGDKLEPLVESLLTEFAEALKKQKFKWKSLLNKNGMLNMLYLDKACDNLKSHYNWGVIPALTYAAIITRYVAMMDAAKGQQYLSELEYADVRRGVSRKTVEDCLDTICHNTNVLEANNMIMSPVVCIKMMDDNVNATFLKLGIPKVKRLSYADSETADWYAAAKLYEAWAAYAEGDMGEKYICDSDNGPRQLKEVLNSCEYDADDVQLIMTLNKAIDVVHFRSDLALAFIEGGKKTCAMVSNLPKEIVV